MASRPGNSSASFHSAATPMDTSTSTALLGFQRVLPDSAGLAALAHDHTYALPFDYNPQSPAPSDGARSSHNGHSSISPHNGQSAMSNASTSFSTGGCSVQHGGGRRQPVSFQEAAPQRAFRRALIVQKFIPQGFTDDLNFFLESLRPVLQSLIKDLLDEHHGLKLWISVEVTYKHTVHGTLAKAHFTTKAATIHNNFELDDTFDALDQEVLLRHAHYLRNASPFAIESVDSAMLHATRYAPIAGAGFKELPTFLANKKCIVNVKNSDERCFGYSILAKLEPITRGSRNQAFDYNRHFQTHGLADLNYPVAPSAVPGLEEQLGLQINIFSFFDDEGKGRYPLYVSKKSHLSPAIDLLYWDGHYALITDFEKLLYDITKMKVRKYICRQCFGHFVSQDRLTKHQLFCSRADFNPSIFTLPPPGTILKYKNIRYQQRVPFVVYADSESICLPHDVHKKESHFYAHHVVCAIGYKLVSEIPEFSNEPYQSHTGPDVMDWFMAQLRDLEARCMALLFDNQRLVMTMADQRAFNAAWFCYICNRALTPGDKVRDHDHITGRYRGAAHDRCNILLRKTYKIPVFFHNFRGYDSHHVVWGLRKYPTVDISLIGQGMEKYLTLAWGEHLVFKDSYQFLASSLEALAANLLRAGRNKFKQMEKSFRQGGATHPQLELLLRKGVFPYDYLNCWERMADPALPSQADFHSALRQEDCSNEDYQRAQQVWQSFQCRSLQDYLELYLKTDVLLLADVYEEFRGVCMVHYGLDPAHYVSSPQLSWDSMLKLTDCSLELVSDPEIFSTIDPGIRGGVSMITHRHASANNPYISSYQPEEERSYIIYLDANNLYGWAMSQPMPYGGFCWVPQVAFRRLNWLSQEVDQPIGYFIECDLEYPAEIHSAHNDYPLAPERLNIQAEMLSGDQVTLRAHYKIPRSGKNTKLVPNLLPKTKYLTHYLNLKFYLEHGMRLTKVHRVLSFVQSRWLAPYIEKNSALRAVATNDFEKEFFKLMNNSIYGKTCENQKKRTDIKLVTQEEKRKKLMEKPHCMSFKIFDEDLAAVEMRKLKTMIDKPFYVGFSVLELSKLHMYRFHYDYFMKKYPTAKLLFTDTDSLMYWVRTDDIYKEMYADREHFDFASYDKKSPFFDATNNKVIGKFKDEASGKPITEFVGLRPKMYSFLIDNDDHPVEKHRAKGINRGASKQLRHALYKAQLTAPVENYLPNQRIGHKLHQLYTIEVVFIGR